jgi:hypothetical protein
MRRFLIIGDICSLLLGEVWCNNKSAVNYSRCWGFFIMDRTWSRCLRLFVFSIANWEVLIYIDRGEVFYFG